jgi:hypothetical protein
MNEIKSAEIYRVSSVSVDRWDVYEDPKGYPVASFGDKAAALNYAMCLARGRVAWHLLLKAPAVEASVGHATVGDSTPPVSAAQH